MMWLVVGPAIYGFPLNEKGINLHLSYCDRARNPEQLSIVSAINVPVLKTRDLVRGGSEDGTLVEPIYISMGPLRDRSSSQIQPVPYEPQLSASVVGRSRRFLREVVFNLLVNVR